MLDEPLIGDASVGQRFGDGFFARFGFQVPKRDPQTSHDGRNHLEKTGLPLVTHGTRRRGDQIATSSCARTVPCQGGRMKRKTARQRARAIQKEIERRVYTAGWRRYGALKKPVDVASTGFFSRCQKLRHLYHVYMPPKQLEFRKGNGVNEDE